MKRVISVLILIIILFFSFQWGFTLLKKQHEVSYKVFVKDEIFEIKEKYDKEQGDVYDITIKNGNNNYNKQKKIIKEIKYYNDNNNACIYPILESGEGTYIECSKNGKTYTDTSFIDQNYIASIKIELQSQGYYQSENIDLTETKTLGQSTIYQNTLREKNIITLWNYKGIDIIRPEKLLYRNILEFDKYENHHGYLVDKYYIVPNYLNSKVSEFSAVTIINIEDNNSDKIELNYTLSSNTYINGVIDGKLYYTDPSNLLQIEVNPNNKKARLIGSKEIGGQLYQGKWKDINIYDLANSKILFSKEIPTEIKEKYNYVEIIESNGNYYFYNSIGEIYRVSSNDLEKPILLLKTNSLNNFKVAKDIVYFVSNDTLYSYKEGTGLTQVLTNNELRYNTLNRIDVYTK